MKPCRWCGESFDERRRGGEYCSDDCKDWEAEVALRRAKEASQGPVPPNPTPKGETMTRYIYLADQIPEFVRIARGDFTQTQAAAAVRVHPQTWSRWERGSNCPDLNMMDQIARRFGLRLELRITQKPASRPRRGASSSRQ